MDNNNTSLFPCPHCGSHIKTSENHTACPFCGESLTTTAIQERSSLLGRLAGMGTKKRRRLITATVLGLGAATWVTAEIVIPTAVYGGPPAGLHTDSPQDRTDEPGFEIYGGPPDPRNDEEQTAPQAVSPIDAGPSESPDDNKDKSDATDTSDEEETETH